MVQLSRLEPQAPRLTEATHLPGIKFQKVDRLSNISVRFAPGFPRLKNLPRRQFKAPAAHDRCRLDQDVGPLFGSRGTPGGELGKDRLDEPGGIVWCEAAQPANHLARTTGIERNELRP